jgi:parvulin-like peptidyl-prolyl isomerase
LLDRKTRQVAQEMFKNLQDEAVKRKAVEKILDDPERRRQMPGVAATVYGDPITIRELSDECLERHATEVLDGTISRKIVEIEAKKRGITATEAEIDKEIAATALEGMRAKPDGSPDVEGWLAMIKKRGVSPEVYRHDAIWPAVVLKKLVAQSVQVSDEDLKRGFESNYGIRVRCKAIVLNDQRRALEVFDMARKEKTSEHFGRLAMQYSIEPGSQRLMGDVPPVRKYCGQDELERQAFALIDGELSGVFQMGDKFIILRCEGHTKPDENIKFAEVRDLIQKDLHEKKLQRAMAAKFEELKDGASITNFIAGTTHSPQSPKTPTAAVGQSPQSLPYR